jgi:hypothetical protein
MDLHCTHCQSTDLRKVSLVYQQGRFDVKSRTRLRGLLLRADGPDLLVGYARTASILQTDLSRKLRPPVKWSYLKLLGWFAISSFVALVAYVQVVLSSSVKASSLPVVLSVVAAPCLLLILEFLTWRHNHFTYPLHYARWDRSFLCVRCGKVSADPRYARQS